MEVLCEAELPLKSAISTNEPQSENAAPLCNRGALMLLDIKSHGSEGLEHGKGLN